MNTNQLKRFAKDARIKLLDQVGRKLEFVLANKSQSFIDTYATEISNLKNKVRHAGKEQVIEMVAYTWFNRLMSFRFMDANGYTIPKVVTPLPGMTNPEILQNALGGNIEPGLQLDRQRLIDLLDGKTAAIDAHTEAYKMLLIASCNQWHSAMPFMFERISDYTELLLPDDLLSDYSIVTDIRNGMSDEDCQQEELIGWLYQFYISDKKDDVFEGLKKNIKISAENIPAATQLFTPHWIVRYMVENTLGKLWLTLKPNSKLKQYMPYFIEAPEGNAPGPLLDGIKGVTDITFLDPCQGSGHVLVYAFALFTKIYEEEGYNTNEIPTLILQHNLFGIDIDQRAAQLAAFALTMKARSYYPRFLRNPVQPNVLALENVSEDIINQAVKIPLAVGENMMYDYRDLSLYLLTQADNCGSLIQIDPEELKALQIQKGSIWHEQELKMVQQAEYLSQKYHCVVTNPPYLGSAGMNEILSSFAKKYYSFSKGDLFSMFIERCITLCIEKSYVGMITMQSWMFLGSFEELRKKILGLYHISTLIQIGFNSFPELNSKFALACSFVIKKLSITNKGCYINLNDAPLTANKELVFLNKKNNNSIYYIEQRNFSNIPGNPIGYWILPDIYQIFQNETLLNYTISDGQTKTGNNSKYVREFWEVSHGRIGKDRKWISYAKGGGFRKFSGNLTSLIDWSESARIHYRKDKVARILPEYLWYRKGITWGLIGLQPSFRILPEIAIFDVGGSSIFFKNDDHIEVILGYLNSSLAAFLLKLFNPTLNFQINDIRSLPFKKSFKFSNGITQLVNRCIEIVNLDWNLNETSLGFEGLDFSTKNNSIKQYLFNYNERWVSLRNELLETERKIDEYIFKEFEINESIEIIGNQDKLSSIQQLEFDEVLNCISSVEILIKILSYSVGCTFGRYSLDSPGLISANQGETLQDFLMQIPNPTFMPDEDNIIPVLDGEWFTDDVVGRFKIFLKAAFGEEHFEENLRYIEETIGKDVRKYFVKDFYNDHVKRYKKRPIYWMFSSPKGHFKALIYMHRYQPDLCSKLLNDYLQAFISKLEASKQTKTMFSLREDISAREKNAALNEIDKLELMLRDCRQYEKTLFTIATQKISIDLDDGVKVNYQKFKEVLVSIKGLEKEEE